MLRATFLLVLIVLAPNRVHGQEAHTIDELWKQLSEIEEANRRLQIELENIRLQLNSCRPASRNSAEPRGVQQRSDETEVYVRWRDLTPGESRIRFYGQLRLDVIRDSSRPDNSQKPFFVLPASDFRRSEFTMHPRLTRLGVDFSPLDGSPPVTGKFEIDFQNGGLESRQILRIRHAYLQFQRKGVSLLAGQTWDIISPLNPTVNNDTLMWNAGNLGDRRPQFRLQGEPKLGPGRIVLSGGVALGGAADPADLDLDGFRDAESSGRPNIQARVGYALASRFSAGVWAHRGWQRARIKSPVVFGAYSAGTDFEVALGAGTRFRGEIWKGSNLSDVRGGVGQGLNPDRRIPIRSAGGWTEVNWRAAWNEMAMGYSTDDPANRDLSAGIEQNRAWYWANRVTLGRGLTLGFDYIYWTTQFQNARSGRNHRTNVFLQYLF